MAHRTGDASTLPLVSVIVPVRNCAPYLDELLQSVVDQTYRGPLEVSIFDDGSSDSSAEIIESWKGRLEAAGIRLQFQSSGRGAPARGTGFARNRAVEASAGAFLCFNDGDDKMLPRRIELQLAAALERPGCLVGSRYVRDGECRPRDTFWHNNMTQEQLVMHRLRETTIVQPTWFCERAVFDAVGGYPQQCPYEAEDLVFFHAHLRRGGTLHRVDEPLLLYRAPPDSITASRAVPKELIWDIRVRELVAVLREAPWASGFTIWNAGKEGRRLYRSLPPELQVNVRAFCDVDPGKIEQGFYHDHAGRRKVPIVLFSEAKPPIVLCVKPMLTGDGPGNFEANLASLNLREGLDYLHFS